VSRCRLADAPRTTRAASGDLDRSQQSLLRHLQLGGPSIMLR
jgi:hypothetical protein